MSPVRRVVVALVALGTIGAACSPPSPDVIVERRAESATESDGVSTVPAPTTTEPPLQVASTVAPENLRLSAADALLRPDEVAPPWEFMHDTEEQPGYGAGPNQTNCAPYWEYERLMDLPNAAALWWRDGGNLNHQVHRAPSADFATAFLETMRTLPQTCSVTYWSEGDSFKIVPVDLGRDDIVGLQFVQPHEELHHVAISVRDELISVIWVIQWPPFEGDQFPHTTFDDLARLAGRADELLHAAGPELAPTTALATTTTLPITLPATTVPVPPTTTIEPGTRPPESVPPPKPPASLPPISSPDQTVVIEPEGSARTLLTTADLVDVPGWEADQPTRYRPSEPIPVTGCDVGPMLAALEEVLEWESELTSLDGFRATQFVGATSDHSPVDIVDAFARIDECDWEWGLDDQAVSSGATGLAGADAVAVVSSRWGDPTTDDVQRVRLVFYAVGDHLGAITFDWTDADPIDQATMADLTTLAVAKAASG